MKDAHELRCRISEETVAVPSMIKVWSEQAKRVVIVVHVYLKSWSKISNCIQSGAVALWKHI